VNGSLKPRGEATVSVYDSGFMLGDGVWEGLRLYDGRWAFLDDHIARLFEAALAIDLDVGRTPDEVKRALLETAEANGMTTDVHARLMVTRGVKHRPFQHPALSRSGPTMVIIMEHSKPKIPRPIRLATVPHIRGLPMSQDPKLNSHSKLNCILACIAAEKAGADEALMLDVHGFVNTTNACNFFIVRKGEVWTSTGDYCMPGITRQKVIDLCRANGIPLFEKNYSLVETYSADEAFLTGTFGAQTPVGMIDGRRIGTGEMGPMTQRLRALYKDLLARPLAIHLPQIRYRLRSRRRSGERMRIDVVGPPEPLDRDDVRLRHPPRLRRLGRALLRCVSRRRISTIPMREEVIAARERPDPARVSRRPSSGPVPGGNRHWYQKHMAMHMLPGFPLDWAETCVNVHLIRHPARVIASTRAFRVAISFSRRAFRRMKPAASFWS
jgi:branched-chain amino acid aminotransferase